MTKERNKTTIHQQLFKINLTMRGCDASHVAQAITSYLPGSTISQEEDKAITVVDHLGRTWTVLSTEEQFEGAATVVVTPPLGYENIDELMYLTEELKNAGAQGGKGFGIRFFACMNGQPAKAVANLENIVASKSFLLGKVLQCAFAVEERIASLNEDGFVEVIPCNLASNLDLAEMKACIQLGCAISAQAINQSRASAIVQRPENEKYAFRCWLNRMGLTSDEYKSMRNRFQKRLSGDASYKDGRRLKIAG